MGGVSNGVKITVKNFQKKIPIYPKRIKEAILKVFSGEAKFLSGEITVSYVTDAKIKELNLRYLSKPAPTDVLAFNLSGSIRKNNLIADIVISTDTAVRNARIFNRRPQQELNLYLVHGILHLLGYNDRTTKQKNLMRKKEEAYVHP